MRELGAEPARLATITARRECVRALLEQGWSHGAIADELGITTHTVRNDRRALGLPARTRWGNNVISQAERRRREQLAARNMANRKYPDPTPMKCACCGEVFTPTREQLSYGKRLYAPGHYRASDAIGRHARAGARHQHDQKRLALERIKRDRDLLDTHDVAGTLGISPAKVTNHYVADYGLNVERVVIDSSVFFLYEPCEVLRFAREWVRGGDGRRARWFDSESVVSIWSGHGWLAKLMDAKGLTQEEAEGLLRTRVKRRRQLLRHRRGRHKAEHHTAWAHAFGAKTAELEAASAARAEIGLPADRVTRWEVALAVADDSYREQPELWRNYRDHHDPDGVRTLPPELARAAADRVLRAIKSLQNA